MIEYRTDGGDLAEIWINNTLVVMLNSDIHDPETGKLVAQSIAKSLGVPFKVDNLYDWNHDTGYLEKPTD